MTETSAVVFQSLQYETMQQVTETVGHVQEHTEAQVSDKYMCTIFYKISFYR